MAKGDKKYQIEINGLNKIKEQLEAGKKANLELLNDDEQDALKDLYLLSSKNVIYVANVSEEQLYNIENDTNVNNLKEIAKIRLENPDISYEELGQMLSKPIGKSGVSHRLSKISEIAEELRK